MDFVDEVAFSEAEGWAVDCFDLEGDGDGEAEGVEGEFFEAFAVEGDRDFVGLRVHAAFYSEVDAWAGVAEDLDGG